MRNTLATTAVAATLAAAAAIGLMKAETTPPVYGVQAPAAPAAPADIAAPDMALALFAIGDRLKAAPPE